VILITGGLGFIGSHTARAVLDQGESCLLVQRRDPVLPGFLAGEALVAQADITDLDQLLALGRRHAITGIIHLAGSIPWPPGADEPVAGSRKAITSLLNVLQAALEWQVPRVSLASTIGVYYGGVRLGGEPMREDLPLPMTAGPPIPTFKKIGELLGGYVGAATGLEVVHCRIGGIWGPLGNPASPFVPAAQLVHAAVRGTAPDLSALYAPPYAGDGGDLCYVKDCARGLALLQLAGPLQHHTYNVASGRVTTNAELAAAITQAIPGAAVELPAGGGQDNLCLDITRLAADTGYTPEWDPPRAAADYVAWLRAGHAR
jgi:UDP-glucose 4-epimerase